MSIEDYLFHQLPLLLKPGDLLVFNDTRVIPARLFGHKETGGRVEILIERSLDSNRALAHVRASKSPREGTSIILMNKTKAHVEGREGELFILKFDMALDVLMEAVGHIPLPPYLERDDESVDRERYQTIYAKRPGAVAAPTAGLHFDEGLLNALREQGIETGYLTLHVGAGTFQPVRVDDIRDHSMHSEYYIVSAGLCDKIHTCHAQGGRVIAVGTTCVRALESAAAQGELRPYSGDTAIFITPGYRFRVIDGMITNFHLPQSTLLMLVCAFAGYDRVMAAYHEAIKRGYRFYSYGDAMLVLNNEI